MNPEHPISQDTAAGSALGARRRARFRTPGLHGILALVLLAGLATRPRAEESAVAAPPAVAERPVLAEEDTLGPLIKKEFGEVRVEGYRVPLLEMIRMAQKGEARKYEGISTMAFTLTVKLTMTGRGRDWATRCREESWRVYYRAPDQWAHAPIRSSRHELTPEGERRPWDEEDDDMEMSPADGDDPRDLTELPIYLERLDKFSFSLLGRTATTQSVLYEIAFEPRSDFETLPSGKLWLLSPQYQIVREELEVEHVPYPWAIKGIDLLTREWQELEGRWVEKRITGRVKLGLGALPFGDIPESMEAAVQFTDYRFDLPLDDALFGGKAR